MQFKILIKWLFWSFYSIKLRIQLLYFIYIPFHPLLTFNLNVKNETILNYGFGNILAWTGRYENWFSPNVRLSTRQQSSMQKCKCFLPRKSTRPSISSIPPQIFQYTFNWFSPLVYSQVLYSKLWHNANEWLRNWRWNKRDVGWSRWSNQ